MKRILIESLTLRNWRGEKERTTRFNLSAPTRICGDNGLGKSRHFDAFCWLLFGKDSQERKDYELRSYDAQHTPLHHCECSVEGVLVVDGEEITLKREWQENWVKPTGQTEANLKNNETKCAWNGVPVTKTEFDKRVAAEIMGDVLFKMLTNPRYFCEQMKWPQQRDVLLQMAGEKSYEELAADNADFRLLLQELGGKSLSDFRKETAATKKRLKDEADKIPARMDEVERGIPAEEDWDALTKQKETIQHKIESIEQQLQDSDARSAAQRKERDDINKEIYICQAEQASILRKAREQAQAECDNSNEYRRGIENSLRRVHEQLSEANIDIKRGEERVKQLEAELERTDKELDELRGEWYSINKTAYDEASDICPYCGQRMPAYKMAEVRAKFAESKQAKLTANNERGKALAKRKAELKEETERKRADVAGARGRAESAENGIKSFTEALQSTPAATVREVKAADLPAWQTEQAKIDALEKKLEGIKATDGNDPAVIADLKGNKTIAQSELTGFDLRLARRERIAEGKARLSELEKRGKQLALQIAELEGREFVAAQLSKKKIEDCEQRINGMFERVKFQMFDYTLDGGEKEVCVPLVDGVPYSVANTASQLNAGLDIINTLCRFNNTCAPIFIDNAESVNTYTATPSQEILLQVTDDKELIIK